MEILEHYYNNHGILYIEFSMEEDGDDYYRILELSIEDIEYYSPTIVTEDDIPNLDGDFIVELIQEYLKENDLPETISL